MKKATLWRAEWYASSQHQTAYIAGESITDIAPIAEELVKKSMTKDEAQPELKLVKHGDVYSA